jgi:hypothetical protein
MHQCSFYNFFPSFFSHLSSFFLVFPILSIILPSSLSVPPIFSGSLLPTRPCSWCKLLASSLQHCLAEHEVTAVGLRNKLGPLNDGPGLFYNLHQAEDLRLRLPSPVALATLAASLPSRAPRPPDPDAPRVGGFTPATWSGARRSTTTHDPASSTPPPRPAAAGQANSGVASGG